MTGPERLVPQEILSTPEAVQDYLAQISLSKSVPADVQKQFEVAKKLCLHACFVYEFWTVSNLVALTAVESALKHRFTQYYSGHFGVEKDGRTEIVDGDYERLRYRLQRGWKLIDWPRLRPSLESLAKWAARKGLLGELEKITRKSIPTLRNAMVHPDFQNVVPPGMALTAVSRCGQITSQLFASTPTGEGYSNRKGREHPLRG